MRPLRCLLGRHAWTGWKGHKGGCGISGCAHHLRHCTRCRKWQHRLAEGKPRGFKWGGLFERKARP